MGEGDDAPRWIEVAPPDRQRDPRPVHPRRPKDPVGTFSNLVFAAPHGNTYGLCPGDQ
ncbi:MAG: hypothetical protein M3N52_06730 [Actinomycetota bacterium]|nr:hypothetical protein [Actinomycetota bacterium]